MTRTFLRTMFTAQDFLPVFPVWPICIFLIIGLCICPPLDITILAAMQTWDKRAEVKAGILNFPEQVGRKLGELQTRSITTMMSSFSTCQSCFMTHVSLGCIDWFDLKGKILVIRGLFINDEINDDIIFGGYPLSRPTCGSHHLWTQTQLKSSEQSWQWLYRKVDFVCWILETFVWFNKIWIC